MEFYRRNYIEGLFLSSAVMQSPDHTMERMVGVAELFRTAKAVRRAYSSENHSGSSSTLVQKAGLYADRISVNIGSPRRSRSNGLLRRKRRRPFSNRCPLSAARYRRVCSSERPAAMRALRPGGAEHPDDRRCKSRKRSPDSQASGSTGKCTSSGSTIRPSFRSS